MKFQEALDIINPKEEKGFMVAFDVIEGRLLRSDHFPDKHDGEPLIPSEHEAWDLAEKFAAATDNKTVNIYVIDETFSPVKDYNKKELKRYR